MYSYRSIFTTNVLICFITGLVEVLTTILVLQYLSGVLQKCEVMKTAAGAPIGNKLASLSVGPRGPLLLQDHVFLDEMSHFDRERIPERVVHAKGAGRYRGGGLISPLYR